MIKIQIQESNLFDLPLSSLLDSVDCHGSNQAGGDREAGRGCATALVWRGLLIVQPPTGYAQAWEEAAAQPQF